MTNKIKKQIELYNQGLSTYQIAQLMNTKQNNIYKNLRYYGVIREALGLSEERQVINYLRSIGYEIEEQIRGDAPYDALIQGYRVDIKSANLATNNRYYFEISHRNSNKDYKTEVDWFTLLFKDTGEIYNLNIKDINVKTTLSIPMKISTSKYPLKYVGSLS